MMSRQWRMPCGNGTFTWPKMSDERFMRGRGGFAQKEMFRGAAPALFSKQGLQETNVIELGILSVHEAPLLY
jgi:hypothetical protein